MIPEQPRNPDTASMGDVAISSGVDGVSEGDPQGIVEPTVDVPVESDPKQSQFSVAIRMLEGVSFVEIFNR